MIRPEFRFEVGCSGCGVLDHAPTLPSATAYALCVLERHEDCEGGVSVLDLMANHGKPHLWAVSLLGLRVLETKP